MNIPSLLLASIVGLIFLMIDPVFGIILFAVAYFIFSRLLRDEASPELTNSSIAPGEESYEQEKFFEWPCLYEFDFEIVGESHYQESLSKLNDHAANQVNYNENVKPVFLAQLIPDDNNPYDKKAVEVNICGARVGYLSKEDARKFRRRLGAKKLTGQTTTCQAAITGGFIMKDGAKAHYGVMLDLKTFEE